MREIKFRMWRDGRMQKMLEMSTTEKYNHDFQLCETEAGDRGILMQYTGVKDKNGIEIYEGDIIEATERRYFFGVAKGLQTIRFKSEVVYEDAGFVYSTNQENDSPLFATDGIQVIGNIHQNPELIKSPPLKN